MKNKEEMEFEVTCCQSLSKSEIPVFTSDYTLVSEGETEADGSTVTETYYDTACTSWADAYKNNSHHTPLELINMFKRYLHDTLEIFSKHNIEGPLTPNTMRDLMDECSGWVEDELDIMED